MGRIINIDGTFANPASAGAYAAGDEISNSVTQGSVVRTTFDLNGFNRGKILQAAMDVTPASGNFVIVAANFELLIFKTVDVPTAVGDNVTHPITGPQRRKACGMFLFDDGGWYNQLGAFTAGTSGYQVIQAGGQVPLATPTLFSTYEHASCFDFTGDKMQLTVGGTERQLTMVLRALAAWTPTAVINTFNIRLTIDAE